jgi:enamine deaminase RidA (YjgF/YER057c/UK114 family)
MLFTGKECRMRAIKTEKLIFPGSHIISFRRSFGTEYFITAIPEPGLSPQKMFEQIFKYIETKNATIISQDVFGLPDCRDGSILDKYPAQLSSANWPVTWLTSHSSSNPPKRRLTSLWGTYIWAISGADVTPIYPCGELACPERSRRAESMRNRVVGNIVEDEFVRFVRLGGLTAEAAGKTPQQQAKEVLEQIETALKTAGMDFSNVVRTWFYNQNITSWYRKFNLVRNEFFKQRNVFSRLVPASTAVGKRNEAEVALIGGCLAIQGKDKNVQPFALPSPLQGPALEYGSSFSRAVELALPDHRRLYISGTASIEPNGKTIYPNDTPGQVSRSMEVIYAILKSRAMDWPDITRAIAYFKHAEEAVLLNEYCCTNALPLFPVIVTENDICRDDLLFEIEVDAITKRSAQPADV